MSYKISVLKEEEQIRLDKFLFKKFEASFSAMQKLIREKKIKLNGARIDADYKVQEGDEIEIFADLKKRKLGEKIRPTISKSKIEKFFSWKIYEDENLIAIDKPSKIAVQGRSLKDSSIDDILNQLKKEQKQFFLVHRIDRDTSGVLLLAKNKKTATLLSDYFRNKKIHKKYLALVVGETKKEKGEINIPLLKKRIAESEKVYPDFENGQEAISKFVVKKRFKEFTLLEVMPITGRTHQIRVHLKEIGNPIVNDVKYGGKKVIFKDIKRMCLHALQIEIEDYFGKELIIKTAMPEFAR